MLANTTDQRKEPLATLGDPVPAPNRAGFMRPQPVVRIFNAYFPARTLLLAVSELIMMFLALVVATYARFWADATITLFYENGWERIAIVCLVCLLCLYYYELYDSTVLNSTREVFLRLVQVVGTACIILAVLYYLVPSVQIRTTLFVPAVSFMGACLIGWRRVFSVINYSPSLAQRIAFLGTGPLAHSLASEINNRPDLGFRLIGFVSDDQSEAANGFRRIGDLEEMSDIVTAEQIDRLVVTMDDRRRKLRVEKLLELKTRGVVVEDGSAFYETVTGKVPLESLRVSELVFGPGFFAPTRLLLYKRVLSVAISLVCLILALPVMGLTALAIWLDSGTPILFRQKRVGKGGSIFTLFKFRSMKIEGNINASGNGKVQPAEEKDERFTRIGRVIRKLRVDELPQLYNIMRGDMYFVGPRPFMVEEEEELAREIPLYRYRWAVKPGATGWAQIHRPYCANLEDNKEKLSYDLFYIKHMSLGLDLLILFQTVKILLWRRGAR